MGKLVAGLVALVLLYLVLQYGFPSAGSGNEDLPPELAEIDNPKEVITKSEAGTYAPPYIVKAVGRDAYFPNEIFKNFRLPGTQEMIADVKVIEQVENCKFLPVSGGMKLANVHIGTGEVESNFNTYSERDVTAEINGWVVANNKSFIDVKSLEQLESSNTLKVVDVAITDQSNIIYLILQSYQSGVIWNIHAGPKTRIANVAVVSYGPAGVIGVDESVKVQIMDARQNPGCPVPALSPLKAPDTLDVSLLPPELQTDLAANPDRRFKIRQKVNRSYRRWFKENFGTNSTTDMIGLHKVSHVLVGPLPETEEQKINYTPLTGQTLRISANDIAYLSETPEDAKERAIKEYSNLIAKAAGSNASSDLLSDLIQGTKSEIVIPADDAVEEAVFNVNQLTSARTIGYSRTIQLSDILQSGEAMPAEYLHDLYVNTRARQIVLQECELVLRVLASKCAPYTLETSKNEDGSYLLNARLAFAPVAPDDTQTSEGDYLNPTVALSLNNEGIEVPKDALQKGRIAYYERAHMVCAAVRKKLGNCVVEAIDFETTRAWNSDSKVRMTAVAKLAVRGSSEGGKTAITNTVNEMLAANL